MDRYECVWSSRNHRGLAQNFFTTGFHFLSPKTNLVTLLIRLYRYTMCVGTEYIRIERTGDLNEPFIRHVRSNTSGNWDLLHTTLHYLHTYKFEFRNADFLHIKYKKPKIHHNNVRCNFKVHAEKLWMENLCPRSTFIINKTRSKYIITITRVMACSEWMGLYWISQCHGFQIMV